MSAALHVISPGLQTTVQDLGRAGHQHLGIPASGAMDPESLALANALVGNTRDCAALEIMFQGPALEVVAESVRVALAGTAASSEIADGDGVSRPLPAGRSVLLRQGQVLRIGALPDTSVCYLAVEDGFDLPPFLGSLATYVRGGFGGLEGRALATGDRLPLNRASAEPRAERILPAHEFAPPDRIRVVLGPQDDHFTPAVIETFLSATYRVSTATDRMGMRLEGPALDHAHGFDIVSDAIAPGAIQVPGNGQPIVLLADRQTTGGYPKIATAISADLAALGRLRPGTEIRFTAVSLAEAAAARSETQRALERLIEGIAPLGQATEASERALHDANLIGGVVSATGFD